MASRKEKPTNTYVWTGSDRQGKPTGGELEAATPAQLRTTLRRQGIRVKSVKKKSQPLFSQKLKGKDIAIATRQLAVMLNSGIPIATSYGAIASGTDHPKIREIFNAIRTDVEGGTALSEALARFPRQFDELYTNLVAVGERSGNLDSLMEEIANYMENLEEIKAKIKGALFYPAAVLVVGIGVSTLLLLFVVPQFEALFSGFGASLPALTAGIVAASVFVQAYWLPAFTVLVVGIVGIVMSYRRSEGFQRAVDRISLKMPVFGNLLKKASISRYARTLATMFGSGVPLVEALTSVSGATGSSVYKDACLEIREAVSTGRSLSASMADTGLFPTMVIQMTNTGEDSGSIEEMLNKAADFYESEVREMVDNMSKLIEPLMMVVLGGLVGTLVVGMYLPIFKMGQVV